MSALTRDAELSPGIWGETWVLGPGPLVPPRKPYPMAPGAPSSLQLPPPQRERGSVSLGWHRPVPPGQATLPRPPNESDPGLCGALETPARGRAPEHATSAVQPGLPLPLPPRAQALTSLGRHVALTRSLATGPLHGRPRGSPRGRAHSHPEADPS